MLTRSSQVRRALRSTFRPGYDVPPGYYGQRWREKLEAARLPPVSRDAEPKATVEPGPEERKP